MKNFARNLFACGLAFLFVLLAGCASDEAKIEEISRRVAKEEAQNAEGQPPGGAMTAEFPNFPYPWYITQVRASLWNQWSARMPSGGRLAAVIGFQIGKGGAVSAIKAERSSGNKLFDFAAMSAVEASAPFPPLPREYKQKTLSVHVEFKVAE